MNEDPAGPWSHRSGRLAGLVLFALVLAWMARIVLLEVDRASFDRAVELGANVGLRGVACLAWLALLRHGLGGLRVVVLESAVDGPRWDRVMGPAVWFLTFALALPGWAMILRPWLEGTVL